MATITLLDGPLGTELTARGVETRLPHWSAGANVEFPDVVRRIHGDYANAGSTVHTANTFRTKRRTVGPDWRTWTQRAVQLARESVPSEHRVAGSIAPLEDCYRPDLSPTEPRAEHREMAEALAEANCDILLCETFPHVDEAIVAVEEAMRTDTETWVAFTAGPEADLLTPEGMAEGAQRAVAAGAAAVLVNCTPALDTLRFVTALGEAALGVPIGAYANAGRVDHGIGWVTDVAPDVASYLQLAKLWMKAGATLIGGCCGPGPAHIEELAQFLQREKQ